MTIAARRHLTFERLHNFRDLGGYPTADGRQVRWGRLYRSDSLGKLSGNDLDQFAAIGIRTVIDLRHSWEVDKWGRVPDAGGMEYYNFSIEHRPYDQSKLSSVIDPVRFLADRYAEVASDGSAEIGQALRVIAAARQCTLVFHCASGKDRTGIIAALVLSMLGVGDGDIVADSSLTGLRCTSVNSYPELEQARSRPARSRWIHPRGHPHDHDRRHPWTSTRSQDGYNRPVRSCQGEIRGPVRRCSMGLPVRQRRVLERIENALRGSDPKLAALYAIFARLTRDEEMPRMEQMRHRALLTLARVRLRLANFRSRLHFRLLPRQRSGALLPAGDRPDGDVDRLRRPIKQQHVHARQVRGRREDPA